MSPWKCMNENNFIMTLLIYSLKSPRMGINVYIRPLIHELKELWEEGVKTYDVYNKEELMMHAAIL